MSRECQVRNGVVQVFISFFCDIVLLLIPLPTILSLKRPLRQRLAIYAVLALQGQGEQSELPKARLRQHPD